MSIEYIDDAADLFAGTNLDKVVEEPELGDTAEFERMMHEEGMEDSRFSEEYEEAAEEAEEVETEQSEDFLNEFAQKFEEVPDDVELPIGGGMTKAELEAHLSDLETFNAQSRAIESYIQNFSAIDADIERRISHVRTENDVKMASLYDKLAEAEEEGNYHLMGLLNKNIKTLQGNQAILDAEFEQVKVKQAQRDAKALQVKEEAIFNEMSSRYGKEWNDVLWPALVDDIQKRGYGHPDLVKAASPALMEVLLEAKKYRDMNKKAVERATSKAKPSATRSTTSSSRQQPVDLGKKNLLAQKLNKGMASKKDVSDAFAFLED